MGFVELSLHKEVINITKMICPACRSNAYGRIKLEDGKYHCLGLMHSTWESIREVTRVDVFGCADCGFMGLYNFDNSSVRKLED